MSYDFLTMPRPCDHYVASERLTIGPDHRTLYSVTTPSQRMTKPVNGEATVTLKFNGVPVPRNHPRFGWDLLWDEFSIAPDFRSKIVFRRPVRLRDIIIEASFVTTAAYCAKCGGSTVVSDYSVGQDGSFRRVTKRTKLVQRSLKFLLTSKCRFYPALTCQLRDYVGRKYGATLVSDDISFEVSNALEGLKRVQGIQGRFQRLDPEEVLRAVEGVSTTRDENDPTVLRVMVDVSSPAGVNDSVNIGLRVAY